MKDQIINGWVVLDGMAFSKVEILEQRRDICTLLVEIEKLRNEVVKLHDERDNPEPNIKERLADVNTCLVCGGRHGGLQCPNLKPTSNDLAKALYESKMHGVCGSWPPCPKCGHVHVGPDCSKLQP